MDTNEQKLTVERFITLVSDPLEATRHFNGKLKDAFQNMYNEISANETALTTFTHAMGYMQEIAEMYYTSLGEERPVTDVLEIEIRDSYNNKTIRKGETNGEKL